MSTPDSRDCSKVIIVGGGMAGLGAAYELTQRNVEVVVLEAQGRPGGRVQTLRQGFQDGLTAEAGAEFLPKNHELTMKYIKLFGLESQLSDLTRLDVGDWLYYVRDRRIRLTTDAKIDWPYNLTPEEQQMGLTGLTKAYAKKGMSHIGDPSSPHWPPPAVQDLDALTFADFMRSKGASQGAADLLSLGYNQLWGDGAGEYTALGLVREEFLDQDLGDCYGIIGGNDRLPAKIADALGARVLLGAEALRIEQDQDGATVVFRQNGALHRVSGSHVVCALPFFVLRNIEVDPPFPSDKAYIISHLRSSSVTRIYLQMREQFWRTEGLDGRAITNLPIGLVTTTFLPPGGPGILQCYVSGLAARDLAAVSEKERVQSALDQLTRIFPAARDHFVCGVSKCWDQDPWERGAYAWFAPGELTKYIRVIRRPEGRVHFAGDHTSPLLGWIQGALESAQRVTQELLQDRGSAS